MDNERKIFVGRFKRRLLTYCKNVVFFVDSIPRSDISGQIIVKQLLRSATSIAANYIEAQASPSKKDFTNFLSISLKSANETIFWFDLLLECGKGNRTTIQSLLAETIEFGNYFGSSIRKLRS
ncbi:four helix bundle protein [Candidatus Gottesmanbacteria bacterium]|nr:four helix bundle protein [Candidatus Gottesmanbacteria bacterium]